jgi:hypothetical protein
MFPGASEIKRQLAASAEKIIDAFNSICTADWLWFENVLSYDNAVLPHALFLAGRTIGDDNCIRVAVSSCDFLLSQIFNGNNFSFVGNKGWFRKGKSKADYDQQPIDAASTALMLKCAYETTLNRDYLFLQRKAFDWFLGANDLSVPIYDFKTQGCCDGLLEQGVNENQGAESTLSFMLSLLTAYESLHADSAAHQPKKNSDKPAPQTSPSADTAPADSNLDESVTKQI